MFVTKRTLINLGLLTVSLVVALVLAEIVTRQFVRIEAFRFVSDDDKNWTSAHPRRQYALTPGYRGYMVSTEFRNRVVINDRGLRVADSTLVSGPGRGDVFVIGDSFVFGVGVEANETIAARLQVHLSGDPQRPTGVWNLGVPSYSFQQYTDMLEQYLDDAHPRLVVYCLYVGTLTSRANDLVGAVDFRARQASRDAPNTVDHGAGGRPVPAQAPGGLFRRTYGAVNRWMLRHSALYHLLKAGPGAVMRSWFRAGVAVTPELARTFDEGWDILDGELERLAALANEHDFRVVVVLIPYKNDILESTELLSRRFQTLATRHAFAYVDAFDIVDVSHVRDLFYPIDGHLTARGTDFFARAIEEASRSLLRDP